MRALARLEHGLLDRVVALLDVSLLDRVGLRRFALLDRVGLRKFGNSARGCALPYPSELREDGPSMTSAGAGN